MPSATNACYNLQHARRLVDCNERNGEHHGLVKQLRQILGIAANRCVPVDGDKQILNLNRARKTSGVRRQDAIGFLQHVHTSLFNGSRNSAAHGRWRWD